MQNVVGPTLVAMATKFGLGAEIQSPAGLCTSLFADMTKFSGHYSMIKRVDNFENGYMAVHGWCGNVSDVL